MNCQGLSIRKMYSCCMCHPGIPNRCLAVFITPRHHVNTPGADGGHSQMKRRPWECATFFKFISHAPEKERWTQQLQIALDNSRNVFTPLPAPSIPADQPHGPHDLLWTSVTNSSQMDDTDRRADCSWIETLPHLYAPFFYVSFLSLPCTRQGGSVSGRNKLLFLTSGSF